MAGVEAKLFDLFDPTLQGYYKPLFDQARQTLAGGQGSDINIAGNELHTSAGWRAGVMARKFLSPAADPLHRWVAYSLSRFERVTTSAAWRSRPGCSISRTT